jgi:hypothetical protein
VLDAIFFVCVTLGVLVFASLPNREVRAPEYPDEADD